MKTGHIADLHHNPERHSKVMRILNQIEDEVLPEIDLLTNSGENFNNPYNFGKEFDQLLDKWDSITSKKPVATVKATPGKHERDGMIDHLKRAGVVILEPGTAYGYGGGHIRPMVDGVEPKMLLFGVPHAHKANVLSKDGKRLSREEANAKVNQEMVRLYEYYGALRARTPHIPALAVGHGVVQGKNTRDLHAIKNSAIYSTEAELKLMGCDFYAWGHYHNPTLFELINGGYLASFAWSFNELDYKPAITVIDWDTMEVTRHDLDINMRRKLVMFPGDEIPDLTGCDVHLVNNKTEWIESDCKEKGAGLVKVTTEIEKEHKVRSKEVVEAISHQDKFLAVYPEATDRQLSVCEDLWEADKSEGNIPHKKVIKPLWCEIHGSKLFLERMGKETVRIDYRDLDEGLSMLIGPGGHGKSSISDYTSPYSIMFAQPNSLLSTFELPDSSIKQGWEINGKEYRIVKFFKPTLKSPKAEYYAFEGESDKPISELDSGNKGPYDEWSTAMFGSPRKYATSVYNTQFDDNPATFGKQKINPSIFQADNNTLKDLFHELAGTNMKHLEMKCKVKADEFKDLLEKEEVKKAGVEESIPDRTVVEEAITALKNRIDDRRNSMTSIQIDIDILTEKVNKIKVLEDENLEIDTIIKTLKDQVVKAEENKSFLEKELSESGNIDIDDVNKNLTIMETEKTGYETKLQNLSTIKASNVKKQKKFMKDLEDWNRDNQAIFQHNSDVESVEKNNKIWENQKKSSTDRKEDLIRKAAKDTLDKNASNLREYNNSVENSQNKIKTINDQIKTGKEMIDNIKSCPKCDYLDPAVLEKKGTYEERLDIREKELKTEEDILSKLELPKGVTLEADTSKEDKEISEAESNIKTVLVLKPVPDKPEEPEYDDEDVPTFDMDKYNDLKEKVSSFSEVRTAELQVKIKEAIKTISDLQTQIDSKEKHEIDDSPKNSLSSKETEMTNVKEKINTLESDIKVNKSKIDDIEKLRESLVGYDKRIDVYRTDMEFWSDMRVKWGPKGIPARILEHTGPYVDQAANQMLKKYYPIYQLHSETTKIGTDGTELEIFNINVINQETGREKPINSISGEERNFIAAAARHAFRTINEQNTLVKWPILLEDEPDAHVSSDSLQTFWDMMEDIIGERKAVCVSHSPEIKHRSATTIEIRDLGV